MIFINLTKENYSDGQNQFSCAKNTAEFQSLFATGLFSALSSIPGDYLSEYLLTKKDTKTYIALSDYDFDYHDAWATSYTIFHVVDTTGQYYSDFYMRFYVSNIIQTRRSAELELTFLLLD